MNDSQVCPACKGEKYIVTETPKGFFTHGCDKCRATGIHKPVKTTIKGTN